MSDLDFAGVSNYPKINFSGNLEGNGKTFKNITSTGAGVFENIGDFRVSSVIQNLNVENIRANPGSGNYLGGFANVADNVTLRNIHLKSGYVKNADKLLGDISSTGGFIGNVNNTTVIDNCSTSLEVSAVKNVGGFIGLNMNATIKNSYANGKISNKPNSGGFIGLQCISDTTYKAPENVYFDYSKTKISKAVGRNCNWNA